MSPPNDIMTFCKGVFLATHGNAKGYHCYSVFPSYDIVFSHDVTTAMLMSQNKETAAMLVSQIKPLGIALYFYANSV